MHAHHDFPDLLVHDDRELGVALGGEVVESREVAAWPLAATREIRLGDGRRYAYKTQLPPTVEPQFYAAAQSTLMAECVDLGNLGRCRAIAVAWVEAPRLSADGFEPLAYVEHARAVVDAIAVIGGDPPVHLDVSTAAAWDGAVSATADRLRALNATGRFARIPVSDVSALVTWARASSTIDAVTKDPGVVHADLTGEEVLITDRRDQPYQVIDWQRPLRGPREIDLVSLVRDAGLDPVDHVDRVFVQLTAFVRLHWAAMCAHDVLRHLPAHGYETWAADALEKVLRADDGPQT